jgi:hypothetical protein
MRVFPSTVAALKAGKAWAKWGSCLAFLIPVAKTALSIFKNGIVLFRCVREPNTDRYVGLHGPAEQTVKTIEEESIFRLTPFESFRATVRNLFAIFGVL